EVPALLDVERARRRAPGAPGALRALRAGRPRQRQCELSGVREASGDIVRGMTRPATTRVAVLAGVVVVLDQITKLIALARLVPGAPVRVIDDVLALTLVLNPGLAFGLLASVPTEWRWIVALLSLVALVILVRVALRILPRGGFADHGAIGLIFGGA